MDHFAFWAFLLGALSAVSLLIGSILGVMWKPHRSVTASMTAFGGGALLAALAVELVAPTAMCVVDPDLSICHHGQPGSGEGAEVAHDGDNHNSSPVANFWALLIGSAIGGLLFVVLDQIVNANGGYLRKMATTITFMGKTQSRRTQQLLKQLSGIEFLRSIPPDEVQSLVDHVRPVTFHAGERLVKMGDAGDRIYFIDTGEVDVSDETGQVVDKLRAGDMFGEISLLTGAPRTATLTSVGVTHAFTLLKDDYERLRDRIPELEAHSRQIASERLKADDEREHRYVEDRAKWTEDAARALSQGTPVPSGALIRQIAEEHQAAPLAIWLGILLDGIPESLVIGAGFLGLLGGFMAHPGMGDPTFFDLMPWTLIAGLFLSNFPEALSSSVLMKEQGWSGGRVLMLWSSLVVLTGLGAMCGYLIGASLTPMQMIAIEGMAAGAMLTMIAQTMIPEAFHLGGFPISSAKFWGLRNYALLHRHL